MTPTKAQTQAALSVFYGELRQAEASLADRMAAALTAAAEVGELVDLADVMDNETLVKHLELTRSDTIERCAQVADQYADKPLGDSINNTSEAHADGMTYSVGGADTASAIAAAIRALKDEI